MKYVPLTKWYKREIKINGNGYVLVKVPEHPKAFGGGWYYEHRLCAERDAGKVLPTWVTVHHIDGNKTNNHPDNLFVCTRAEHDLVDRLTLQPV